MIEFEIGTTQEFLEEDVTYFDASDPPSLQILIMFMRQHFISFLYIYINTDVLSKMFVGLSSFPHGDAK